MSTAEAERCLAAIYSSSTVRQAFISQPKELLRDFELTAAEQADFLAIDLSRLISAANVFSSKRAKYKRWMNVKVRPVHQYAAMLSDLEILALRAEIHEKCGLSFAAAKLPGQPQQIDLFPWDPASNREHLLLETNGLESISALWCRLRQSALYNHHLWRAYAFQPAPIAEIKREHGHAGAYTSYVCLIDGPPDGLTPPTLNLYNDARDRIWRCPLAHGLVVIVPSDILQSIEVHPTQATASCTFLGFKSLAALQ
jgi:hypothetical protein